jgi:hypothetical protein
MRFLMMHRLDETRPEAWNPSQEFIEKMGAFIQAAADSGVLITAEGVHPSVKGSLVRRAGNKVKVTDGGTRAAGPVAAAVLAGLGAVVPHSLRAPAVLGGGAPHGALQVDAGLLDRLGLAPVETG